MGHAMRFKPAKSFTLAAIAAAGLAATAFIPLSAQAADALEELAAGRVVEILRRQRLLRQRQPGDDVLQENRNRPHF